MRTAFASRQHFTLVELLVVIAIISVLAALLFPALQQAYASARMAQCASNLKQQAIAFTQYAGDNNDYLPPLWTAGPGYNWKSILSKNYLDVNVDTVQSACVFTCPSGAGLHSANQPNCYRGYGMNASAGHYIGLNPVGKITSPRSPSRTLLCSDGSWRPSPSNAYTHHINTTPLDGLPEFVHQARINLAYVDAHCGLLDPLGLPMNTSDTTGGNVFWLGK